MSAPQDPLAEQAAYRELAELETAQEIEKQDSLARQQGEFDAARDTLSASDLQTWLDGAAQIEAVVAKRIDDVVIGLRMTANLLDLIANANRDKADAMADSWPTVSSGRQRFGAVASGMSRQRWRENARKH